MIIAIALVLDSAEMLLFFFAAFAVWGTARNIVEKNSLEPGEVFDDEAPWRETKMQSKLK